jgi:YQGE family putative transporter
LGNSERGVFIYFILGNLAYILLLPFGAMYLAKVGYRFGLVVSTLWNALFYGVFLILSEGVYSSSSTYILLLVSLVCIVLFRLSFWVPYHVEMAELTERKNRGMAVSSMLVLVTLAGVLGPFIGGWLIEGYDFFVVFEIVMVSSLLAVLPLYFLHPKKQTYEWTYKETWREFIKPKHRAVVFGFTANGAENAIGIVVWPLFIFALLQGNFYEMGAVSSLIIAGTVLLELFSGRHLDKVKGRGNMLHVGSVLSAIGWIAKIFVATAMQIFVVGLYHNVVRIFTDTPVDTISYDLAADSGHFIDEFTVLREIAIQMGKVLALVFVFISIMFVDIQYTFLIAAVSAILLNILYSRKEYGSLSSTVSGGE